MYVLNSSGGAAIGNVVVGGTDGSVLFISGTVLAQDNTNFFWDSTNHSLQLGDGSAAHPSYAFKNNTNMGIYRGGMDIMRFVTAGANKFECGPNYFGAYTDLIEDTGGTRWIGRYGGGNVPWKGLLVTDGILSGAPTSGTSTPAAKFESFLNASGAYVGIKIGNTDTGRTSTDGFQIELDASTNVILNQQENLGIIFKTNNTNALKITNSGTLQNLVSGNETTGAGTATFGAANCPAVDVTKVFKWITQLLSDGSTVFYPTWK